MSVVTHRPEELTRRVAVGDAAARVAAGVDRDLPGIKAGDGDVALAVDGAANRVPPGL